MKGEKTMIPMPIYIPKGSESTVEYIYPGWVKFITEAGLILTVIGIASILLYVALMLLDDERFNIAETPGVYTVVVALIGMVTVLIGVLLMALTGVKIEG